MARYSPSVQNLISKLGSLPGIGGKSAQRLAFHILSMSDEDANSLAEAIKDAHKLTVRCSSCQNFTDSDPCPICSDPLRDKSTVCVVESPRDVSTFERMHEYKGLYHVLHGCLSPLDGIGPEELRIKELLFRIGKGDVKEVILATNSNVEGEATAAYLAGLLRRQSVIVSRIARGLPMGGDLEYADEVTLAKALENRTRMSE